MAINGGQTSAVPCAARPVKRTATAAGVRSCGASSTSRICSAISSSATESPKLTSITAVPGPGPAIWRPCSARVRPLTSFRSTSYRSSAPTCGAVLPERQIVGPQWACRGGCESVQQPLMQLPHVARVPAGDPGLRLSAVPAVVSPLGSGTALELAIAIFLQYIHQSRSPVSSKE